MPLPSVHLLSDVHIWEQVHVHLRLYRMRLNFRGFRGSEDNPRIYSLIREYFEQVLQNRKKMDAEHSFYSVVAFVLDRKYKYGRRFVRYQLVTKFSWY